MIDFQALMAPFPPDRISWRVGATNKEKTKGMALAYIDSRDLQDRLDAVCGAAGWQCRYPHAGTKTVCEIGIKIDSEWIWKADGAGDSDVEAEKGALSDAFKRAGVKWGIGRYLYDVGSPWVEIESYGKSCRIKEAEYAKLRRALPSPAVRSEASVQTVDVYKLSGAALTLMAQIDQIDTVKALMNYGATTIKESTVSADERLKVRDHFAARKRALESAELLGAG